jgi:metal-responsive CopG/Arc/MetJ family transcriptional regulator
MGRTQVYLDDTDLDLLDRVSRATGASRSELIRRAVRDAYGERTKEERIAAVRRTAGLWKDRAFTGAEYVDAIRGGDMNAALRRLGLE